VPELSWTGRRLCASAAADWGVRMGLDTPHRRPLLGGLLHSLRGGRAGDPMAPESRRLAQLAADAVASAPQSGTFAEPVCTHAAFNLGLRADARTLAEAGRLGRTGKPDVRQGGRGSPHGPTALVWEEVVVTSVPFEEAMRPHALVLLEIVDDSPTLPRRRLREGRGHMRVGWGYLKPAAIRALAAAAPGAGGMAGQSQQALAEAARVTASLLSDGSLGMAVAGDPEAALRLGHAGLTNDEINAVQGHLASLSALANASSSASQPASNDPASTAAAVRRMTAGAPLCFMGFPPGAAEAFLAQARATANAAAEAGAPNASALAHQAAAVNALPILVDPLLLPEARIALYEPLPPSFTATAVHATSLSVALGLGDPAHPDGRPLTGQQVAEEGLSVAVGGVLDISGVPSPHVAAEYRLRDKKPLPLTLRLSAFPVVVPAVRYVHNHDRGVTYSFLRQDGRPLHTLSPYPRASPPPLTPELVADFGRGNVSLTLGNGVGGPAFDIALHPALGRPLNTLPLPIDVHLENPLITQADAMATAASTSAAAAASQGMTGIGDMLANALPGAGAAHKSRLARGPKEPCLLPNRFIASLHTGKQGAMCLAFSPNGLLLACGCADEGDYMVRVYSVDLRKLVASFSGHNGIIYAVAWSPDSQWLVSSSGDGTALVWHIPHNAATLATARPSSFSAHAYSILVNRPPSYVYAAKFMPCAPHLVVTGSFDGGLRLWDTRIHPDTLQPLESILSGQEGPSPVSYARTEGSFLGFIGKDPNDRFGGGDLGQTFGSATASLYNERIGVHSSYINVIEFDTAAYLPAAAAQGSSAVASATKHMITADGSGTILIWEIGAARGGNNSGAFNRPATYTVHRDMRPAALKGVPIVAIKVRPGHNQMLVQGHQNVLRMFDLNSFTAIRSFPNCKCSGARIEAVFSPDGRFIASGSEDGTLCVWEADSGNTLQARAAVSNGSTAAIAYPGTMFGVAWHPNMHLLATCAFGAGYPVMLVGNEDNALN
jgi:WD40 repeat protein